jgi:putative membrane protein
MKNKIKSVLMVFSISTLTSMSSCMSKTVYTKEVAEELNEEKADNRKEEKDAQFLVDAAEINMIEIYLGELAEEKGSTSYIQALGKMIRENHQISLDRLTILARKKNITLPTTMTSAGNNAYTELNNKSGNDFDESYADLMVSNHEDAISLFEKIAKKGNDRDIRDWAKSEIPALQNHLEESQECRKKNSVL